jgi:hypothetical protein
MAVTKKIPSLTHSSMEATPVSGYSANSTNDARSDETLS